MMVMLQWICLHRFKSWVNNKYLISADAATVTLLPESVAQVCQVGDQLELICIINGTFMRWSVTARNSLGRLMEYGPTFVNAEDESQQVKDIRVNSLTFTSRRNSTQNSSPLVSTLLVMINSSSVNRDLNGTVVSCTDFETSTTATTTIIHYVDDSTYNYYYHLSCGLHWMFMANMGMVFLHHTHVACMR